MTLDEIAAEYVTMKEAAALLGVHDRTLRRHIQAGRVAAILFAGRYLLPYAGLAALRQTRTLRPGQPQRPLCPHGHFKTADPRGNLICRICIADGRRRRRAARKAADHA